LQDQTWKVVGLKAKLCSDWRRSHAQIWRSYRVEGEAVLRLFYHWALFDCRGWQTFS